jgi:hypothetical protein
MRIQDTLHLEQIQISEAFLEEASAHPKVDIQGEPAPLRFDAGGNLC